MCCSRALASTFKVQLAAIRLRLAADQIQRSDLLLDSAFPLALALLAQPRHASVRAIPTRARTETAAPATSMVRSLASRILAGAYLLLVGAVLGAAVAAAVPDPVGNASSTLVDSSPGLVPRAPSVPRYRRCKQSGQLALTFDDGPVSPGSRIASAVSRSGAYCCLGSRRRTVLGRVDGDSARKVWRARYLLCQRVQLGLHLRVVARGGSPEALPRWAHHRIAHLGA